MIQICKQCLLSFPSSLLLALVMTTILRMNAKDTLANAIQDYRDPREDPLSQALKPPPDESEEDRLVRLQLLRAAEQISREIDNSILESKKEFERRKKAITVLLLGITSCSSLCYQSLPLSVHRSG